MNWFIPPNAYVHMMSGAAQAEARQLGAHLASATWLAGIKYLRSHLLPPAYALAGSWNLKQSQALNPGHLDVGYRPLGFCAKCLLLMSHFNYFISV